MKCIVVKIYFDSVLAFLSLICLIMACLFFFVIYHAIHEITNTKPVAIHREVKSIPTFCDTLEKSIVKIVKSVVANNDVVAIAASKNTSDIEYDSRIDNSVSVTSYIPICSISWRIATVSPKPLFALIKNLLYYLLKQIRFFHWKTPCKRDFIVKPEY